MPVFCSFLGAVDYARQKGFPLSLSRSHSTEVETDADGENVNVNRTIHWLIGSAAVLFLCGVLAIVLPITFSISMTVVLGCLVLVAAGAHVVFGLNFEPAHWGWHVLIAGLYLIAAILLLANPLLGVVLLALLVGVVLIAEGIIEIFLFFILRHYRHAFWVMIDGVVTLALGIMICSRWPPEDPDMVQYLVGIGFICSAVSRLLLGFGIRLVEPTGTGG